MRRIACVRLPGFVLQVHLRARDGPAERAHGEAIAVCAGTSGRKDADASLRVIGVSRAAAAAGIRPGMTAVQAQAIAAALTIILCDEALVRAATLGLAEAYLSLTPTVEPHAGWFFLDVGGRGERAAETRLALAARDLARGRGYTARVAVADSRFTAAALARAPGTRLAIVAPQAAAAALASLPVSVLPLGPELARAFALLGLRTVGELQQLRPAQVAARWGAAGVSLHRLAHGIDPTPLTPFVPPLHLSETLALEAPVESLEVLAFGLKQLADRVAARLAGRGFGATHLTLAVALDPPGATLRRELRPARPVTAAATLLALMRAALAGCTLDAPVIAVTLSVAETVPAPPATLDLWRRESVPPDESLSRCIARLRALLGEPAVYAATLADTYRPEAMYVKVPFAPGDPRPRAAPAPRATPPPGALRLLDPPVPAALELCGDRPRVLSAFGARRRVAHARGPVRVAGEWWRAPFARDYFEVILEDGGHYWVFRTDEDRCFVHGIVD